MSSPAVVPRKAAVNTRTLNTTLPTSGFPATLIAGGSSTDFMGGVGKHRQDSMVSSPFAALADVTKGAHGVGLANKNAPRRARFQNDSILALLRFRLQQLNGAPQLFIFFGLRLLWFLRRAAVVIIGYGNNIVI